MRAVALGLALLLSVPAVAATPQETAQARKLFQTGTKHYNLREYDAALADFREAYRLKEDPVLLYNIAQCYRSIGNKPEAVSFYKNYLRLVPGSPVRGEVEQRITTLEGELAEQARIEAAVKQQREADEKARADAAAAAAAIAAQNAVVAAPVRRTPVYKKWWLWTAVGGAVVVGVGLGVGLGLGLRNNGPGSFPNVELR